MRIAKWGDNGTNTVFGRDRHSATNADGKRGRRRKHSTRRRRPGLIRLALWALFSVIWRPVRLLISGFFWLGRRVFPSVGLAIGVVLLATTLYNFLSLPDPENLFDGRGSGSVTMLDRRGNIFAWRGEQYGGHIHIEDVSLHLVHAVVATEDRRFWNHYGIDPRGIARALYVNLRARRLVQGGSTITQQVAKNVFLTQERSLERKLLELPMAFALEMKYSKREILEIYLNRVYLGAGAYGFEAASRRYFGKSAHAVTPAEAAMLAGLLSAPSRYAPTAGIERSHIRAAQIVRAMEREGYLTEQQTLAALTNPARLSAAAANPAGDAFADWMMTSLPSYLTQETAEDVIIRTTFDQAVQNAADQAVAAVFEELVDTESQAQTAVVVMERDGAVRAMVGGRGAGEGRFNRATQAKRQTGSAFKPIVFGAALEAGLDGSNVVDDEPLEIEDWSPRNYTGDYLGPITLTEALARSINTSAVRVSEWVGREKVRELAAEMGMTDTLALGPAVALGTSEATLLDMTSVYATIAAKGLRATPYGLLEMRLRDDDTPLLTRKARPSKQVLTPGSALELTRMLIVTVENGTGGRARIPDWQIAGKTGTTQEARDAWFIGFTADYIIGVWLGNDDNTPLNNVTGGTLPADIWREITIRLTENRTPRLLVPEDDSWFERLRTARTSSDDHEGLRAAESRDSRSDSPSVIESIFFGIFDTLLPGDG